MEFSSKQVVTMVAAVCAAVVLAPVGVMAATGQLVNIADGGNGRLAKVGSSGTVYAETRAGVVDHSFQFYRENLANTGWYPAYEITGKRIAITELTLTARFDSTNYSYVKIYTRVRTSGTANCSTGTGWSLPKYLRTALVRGGSTVQLQFNGPPLISATPSSASQKVCIGILYQERAGSPTLDVAMIGYTFS